MMPPALLALGFAATLLAQACAEPRAAAAGCEARIVVDFAANVDDAEIAAVARANAVTLVRVDRLLGNLYVLDLSTGGQGDGCTAALERLRADSRIRSAELDRRRAPNEG
jgi:hypothetical protein